MKHDGVVGGKVEMTRDVEESFYCIVIEERFHPRTAIRPIQSPYIVPIHYIKLGCVMDTFAGILVVLVKHPQTDVECSDRISFLS